MVVVRLVFQAKSGKAEEVVEGFKQGAEMMQRIAGPNAKVRILTDLSGPFDTVVQEVELASLAEWEQLRAKTFSDSEFKQMQEVSESPFASGRTEFYTLEATF
jgi:hypothetical protein